tara:strand:+ start:302 stop:733 length:432 start_codon:yes stop_codon:yes gene_type:complete
MAERFKLIYTETCTVHDKCRHVVDGEDVEANLMNTVLTPIHQPEYNFPPGTLKEYNYYLREGHPHWDMLLFNFKKDVMNEWLKILGYGDQAWSKFEVAADGTVFERIRHSLYHHTETLDGKQTMRHLKPNPLGSIPSQDSEEI